MAEAIHTRMTAAEFAQLPETNIPTELLDGELIMSPGPKDKHQEVVFELAKLIERVAQSGKVRLGPSDVYLDDLNVPQPDVFWVSGPESKCKLGEDDYWHGPPDLVVEVLSPDSVRRDKVDKFRLYEKHGVGEYWIVDAAAQVVEVWHLAESKFQHQGNYGPGETFTSPVLGGKAVDLAQIFGQVK